MFLDEEGQSAIDESGVSDEQSLLESIFESTVMAMPDEERKNYLESDEVKAALEAGVVGKRTIVRLSKVDDLSRRIKLAALQKAKEDNAAEWAQLKKNRVKERQLLNRIMTKYSTRVRNDAVKAQRALLKVTPNLFTRPLGR